MPRVWSMKRAEENRSGYLSFARLFDTTLKGLIRLFRLYANYNSNLQNVVVIIPNLLHRNTLRQVPWLIYVTIELNCYIIR